MSGFERAIPQWCSGCQQSRTIECIREGCPTAARLAEEAHYAQINVGLLEALETFTNLRDQFPQSAKLINPKLSGMEPVTITVTKAQMLAAVAVVRAAREVRP